MTNALKIHNEKQNSDINLDEVLLETIKHRAKKGKRKAPSYILQEGTLNQGQDEIPHFMSQCEAIGTIHNSLINNVTTQLVALNGSDDVDGLNAALAFMHSLKPRDEIEGLLAAQMFTSHQMAMTFAARAMNQKNPDLVCKNVGRYNRLIRSYVGHVEALNRYRGKGQQKVTVEHVTVNQGGQAIVGVLEHSAGGGIGKDGE